MTRSPAPVRALLLGALAVVAALVVGVVPLSPAGASIGGSLSTPLARETVRPGARDLDVHHVAHVRELQLRLARVGTHRVYWRDIDHYSHEYGGAMPYSQFFDGGQALHGSVLMTNPFEGHSHGCVNFYLEDARQLWRLTSTRRLVVTVHGAWD